MTWRKVNNYEWKNPNITGDLKTAHIIIQVEYIAKGQAFYYVRQYNSRGVLIDSLAEGTKEKAEESVRRIINKK